MGEELFKKFEDKGGTRRCPQAASFSEPWGEIGPSPLPVRCMTGRYLGTTEFTSLEVQGWLRLGSIKKTIEVSFLPVLTQTISDSDREVIMGAVLNIDM